jgi:hypothetical protein
MRNVSARNLRGSPAVEGRVEDHALLQNFKLAAGKGAKTSLSLIPENESVP